MTRLSACLGCGTLCAPGPRCYACRKAATRAYDGTRPAHHKLYATAAWRNLSAEVRASASRCRWCLRPLAIGERVADHIVPLADRPDLALSRDNLAVSCRGCNTRRGRWSRVPDPESAEPRSTEPVSVGDRMAAILGGDR